MVGKADDLPYPVFDADRELFPPVPPIRPIAQDQADEAVGHVPVVAVHASPEIGRPLHVGDVTSWYSPVAIFSNSLPGEP